MLLLIIAGKGSTNLMESCRGLKVNLANLPTVPDDDSDDENTIRSLIKKQKMRIIFIVGYNMVFSDYN